MTKASAKRETEVSSMIEATGMVGELHGMGQAMPAIAAIDQPAMIEGKAA